MDPILRTSRLTLRLLRPDDRAEFIRVHTISHDHFAPWVPLRPADQSLDAFFEQALDRTDQARQDGTAYRFVAFDISGRIIGFFNLSQVFRGAFDCAYASWAVGADAIGQGYGVEGVHALLDFAFAPQPDGAGLHRVQANIIPENTASLRLAERVGFRREGYALRYLLIAGVWRDHIMFARLADEHAKKAEPHIAPSSPIPHPADRIRGDER